MYCWVGSCPLNIDSWVVFALFVPANAMGLIAVKRMQTTNRTLEQSSP